MPSRIAMSSLHMTRISSPRTDINAFILPLMCIAVMMAGSKCVTINVNGLNNAQKRTGIFDQFKRLDYDIVAHQDTRLSEENFEQWRDDWGHHSVWTVGSSQKWGVAFLFGKNLETRLVRDHPVSK